MSPAAPAAWDADVDGRAQALTVLTPIRPGWTPWVRVILFLLWKIPYFYAKLAQLSFIHFAHWDVITRLPPRGRETEQLGYDYLLFESNFDGDFTQYIEAFSEILGYRLTLIWGSSFGYPGPVPLDPFLDYIRRNWRDVDCYWSAYPAASITTVQASLQLRDKLDAFVEQSRFLAPGPFKIAYADFLTRVQRAL